MLPVHIKNLIRIKFFLCSKCDNMPTRKNTQFLISPAPEKGTDPPHTCMRAAEANSEAGSQSPGQRQFPRPSYSMFS